MKVRFLTTTFKKVLVQVAEIQQSTNKIHRKKLPSYKYDVFVKKLSIIFTKS